MFDFNGWEQLEGKALNKALEVTGESTLHFAKKFGVKTVFARDCCGVVRFRAIGPKGEVYGLKVFCGENLDRCAMELSRAAALGEIENGSSVYLQSRP